MTDSQEEERERELEEDRETGTAPPGVNAEGDAGKGDVTDIDTAAVPVVPANAEGDAGKGDVTTIDTAMVPAVPANVEKAGGESDVTTIDTAMVPATPREMIGRVVPRKAVLVTPGETAGKAVPRKAIPVVVPSFRKLQVSRNVVVPVPAATGDFWQRLGVWLANFRLWRLRRPFWGSILMLIASLLMLWGPLSLMRFALLPGSSIWSGILVGALLLVMAIIQLLAPSYSLLTGAIGVVLSIVSLLVAGFGGLVIGMIMGTIGGALGVAWKPNARPLPIKQTHQRKSVQSRFMH